MENFKLENFRREYPNIEFPTFYTLNDKEIFNLQSTLFRKLRLAEKSLLKLTELINSIALVIKETDANNDNFRLLTLLSDNNIKPNALVYLNWYRYDRIDKMRLIDLNKYFNDIGIQALMILTSLMTHILGFCLLRHNGILSLARLTR